MKLKKRQFARLKDIAEAVNHVVPGTGIQLDKLIADIESVQKVKTIIEEPVWRHFSGKSTGPLSSIYSFAAGNIFDEQRKAVGDYIRKQGEAMVAASTDESTEFKGGLSDAVEALTEPKIGDVGYFWDEGDAYKATYSAISEIAPDGKFCHKNSDYTIFGYTNFSKTPPELK